MMIWPREGTYHYARLAAAEDFLRLGWMPSPRDLAHHSAWSVMMFWPCECKAVVPV